MGVVFAPCMSFEGKSLGLGTTVLTQYVRCLWANLCPPDPHIAIGELHTSLDLS